MTGHHSTPVSSTASVERLPNGPAQVVFPGSHIRISGGVTFCYEAIPVDLERGSQLGGIQIDLDLGRLSENTPRVPRSLPQRGDIYRPIS